MIYKYLPLLFILTLIGIFNSFTVSYAATYIDDCSSDKDSRDIDYVNFSYTPKLEELFGSLKGAKGNCLYAKNSSGTPHAIYYFADVENVVVDVISVDSDIVSSNKQGEFALGIPNDGFKMMDGNVFISAEGIAFSRGKTLSYSNGYKFSEPYKSNRGCYLGVNVYAIDSLGKARLSERVVESVHAIPKEGGGIVYLERYSWSLPPNTYAIKLLLRGYTKLWNGSGFENCIKQNPHGITKVEISGEKMMPSYEKINEEVQVELDEIEKKSKSSSNKSSYKKSGLDISAKSENSTTENVTIYDNDTVEQNFYGTKSEAKESKEIDDCQIPQGESKNENIQTDVMSANNIRCNQEDNKTWKIVGTIYIALAIAMLGLALIAKKPKQKE